MLTFKYEPGDQLPFSTSSYKWLYNSIMKHKIASIFVMPIHLYHGNKGKTDAMIWEGPICGKQTAVTLR